MGLSGKFSPHQVNITTQISEGCGIYDKHLDQQKILNKCKTTRQTDLYGGEKTEARGGGGAWTEVVHQAQ